MREATASGDDPTYVRTSTALARGRLLVAAEDQMAHPCRRRLEVLHIDQIGTHLKAYTFDDGDAFRLKLAPLLGLLVMSRTRVRFIGRRTAAAAERYSRASTGSRGRDSHRHL